MSKNQRNIAVILAGGNGSRLGYDKPKQFLKIAGKLVVEHTVEVFQKHSDIDEIAVVCHKDYFSLVEEMVNINNFDKVKKILNGGNERHNSSLSAINAYDGLDVNLIFHDAVRPLVDSQIISNCVHALKTYNAVDVAVLATDTIIKVQNNLIDRIPNRDKLRRGQTPQAFSLKTIQKAYDIGLNDPEFQVSDDCSVVKKYLPSEKIYVTAGNESNLKITYEEDLFLLEKLFQIRSQTLNKDFTNLCALKNKVLILFGGSYGIGMDIAKIAKNYGGKVYSFSRTQTRTDISIRSNVISALEKVYKIEGKIDYVVNTAGVLIKEPLVNMDYKTIEKSIAVNYLGCITIAKESFKYLNKSSGSLLFFTSSSYTRGRSNYSIYSSSKAAIVNFTQAIANEWGNFNIKVNCISPERTLTPMRVKNFGVEDEYTLLKSETVATISIQTLLLPISGQIIDIKR